MAYKPNSLPPALAALLLLQGCAAPRSVLQPVAAPCRTFQVDSQLLAAPESPALRNSLINSLPALVNMTPPASATPTGSANSSRK